MATAMLVDAARVRRFTRQRILLCDAVGTAAYLRRLAAQVERGGVYHDGRQQGTDARQIATLLRTGAWALEDVFGLHPREEE